MRQIRTARRFAAALFFLAFAILSAAGCAGNSKNRDWKPGDSIICPHCGREYPLPEKLGP